MLDRYEQDMKEEDEKYGAYFSRPMRNRLRLLLNRVFNDISDEKHEKLKELLWERIEKLKAQDEENELRMKLLKFIENDLENR